MTTTLLESSSPGNRSFNLRIAPGTEPPCLRKASAPTRHLVIAGGGTGGHLFPGLAVAECLRQLDPSWRVTFAGCFAPWQLEKIAEAGFTGVWTPAAPAGRSLRQAVRFLRANYSGYRAAIKILQAEPVHAVLGLGGYASAPVAKAAADQGLPLALLDLNAVPGRVTRWLAPQAGCVLLNLASARAWLPEGCTAEVVGLPLRHQFEQTRPLRTAPTPQRPQLLVLGGSQGAQQLNECVPAALARLREERQGWTIFHQAGGEKAVQAIANYHRQGVDAQVVPFIGDMAGTMYRSELAISRAGATTLAELACCGLPAALLPYPHSADDHQLRNAEYYATAGGAKVVDTTSQQLTELLAEQLRPLLTRSTERCRMAQAMARCGQSGGALRIAQRLVQLADAKNPPKLNLRQLRFDAPHSMPSRSQKLAA